MNLSNLSDLKDLANLPTTCAAGDGSACMCDHGRPNLTESQKGTVCAAADALQDMDDTIRLQKTEIEELRAELDRRAQTVADMARALEAAAEAQLEDDARSELHNAAPALAALADLSSDAYDALRALWPCESQVGIVRVRTARGTYHDVKIAGERIGAQLHQEDARAVARGVRRILGDIATSEVRRAAALAPTEPAPASAQAQAQEGHLGIGGE